MDPIEEKIKMLGKVDIFEFEEGLESGLDDKELSMKHGLSTSEIEHLKRDLWA
ncbi:hypothetical protein HYG86_13750 [Alkalicella caledoniensis]|uniref:Uncharacterized protein n=1 Tax=Alkalicella caledoniensis TaxID=2731377 RepID=A0A7G9WAN8_ALKCA|nr:hypothetical protein [Alkalicella caledoniensis]QNO15750.1 hypothetical protein HYG86_13750 [Alkalicella caledoniensis]